MKTTKPLFDESEIRTVETPWNCSVSIYRLDRSIIASVEADKIINDIWSISRAYVGPKEKRGKGIGTILLKKMIEITKRQNGLQLVVSPGGYDESSERQFRFYTRVGFKKAPKFSNWALTLRLDIHTI